MKRIWNFLVKACKVTLNEIIKPMLLPWLSFMLMYVSFKLSLVDNTYASIISFIGMVSAYLIVFYFGAHYRKINNIKKEKLTIVKEVDDNGNIKKIFYTSSDTIDELIDINIIEYKDKSYGDEN